MAIILDESRPIGDVFGRRETVGKSGCGEEKLPDSLSKVGSSPPKEAITWAYSDGEKMTPQAAVTWVGRDSRAD